jgi:hypothetical protein
MKCILIEGWWITDNEILGLTIVERDWEFGLSALIRTELAELSNHIYR